MCIISVEIRTDLRGSHIGMKSSRCKIVESLASYNPNVAFRICVGVGIGETLKETTDI